MNETTTKVVTLAALFEEMEAHGWHHVRTQMMPVSTLPGVPAGTTGPDVQGHLFIATTEIGALLLGVVIVDPDGRVRTFSLADGFNDTVDHCARCILRGQAVNTLTASSPSTATLH